MNPFLKKILEATRLTGRGRLTDATAAIQQALADRATPPAPAPGSPASGEVLDGLVREAAPARTGTPASVRMASPAADPAVDAVADVASRTQLARFEESSFTNASGTRAFKLFEPAGFEGRSLPLVVMLHGCTQNPDDFATGTRMNELAQQRGAFVLYPAQAARSNANKCWNWFVPADQRRGQGEPALLAGMTRHVMQTHAVDADRVYVAGLSAGGAMAAILAREYPDLYAAAGIHSGLPAGAAHDVASAFTAMKTGGATMKMPWSPVAAAATAPAESSVPVIVFHGDADATVAAVNGDAVVRAALAAASAGARASAGESTRVDASGERRATRTLWRDAAGATAAEHWLVHGAPHAWSGGASAGSYTDPSGPDASREMLRFFLDHPRRSGTGR